MEMGQLENRYETPNSRGEALSRISRSRQTGRLARRPGGFDPGTAQSGAAEDQMTEEQKRRELERLMRRQEQLSREVAQLAQEMSRVSSSQSSPQNGSQSQSASGSSASAASSAKVPFSAQHSKCGRRRKATLLPSRRRAAKALENLRQQQQAE